METIKKGLNVSTAIISSSELQAQSNRARTRLLRKIIDTNADTDILLLPAGYYESRKMTKRRIRLLEKDVTKLLRQANSSAIVCIGADYRNGDDQLAYAISTEGIIAAGRKFHPTKEERGVITQATGFMEKESGMERTFQVKGLTCYMAVCYDGFGIRHMDIKNPGVDIFLDLVHHFFKKGQGSGDVDFARKGFAGASMQWQIPVFGAVVFFGREVPARWPAGVMWSGAESVKSFKYSDNEITWIGRLETVWGKEKAVIYRYVV